MKKILVTGGAGYIGSHTIVELIQSGYEVVSVDHLQNSDGTAFDGIELITGVRIKNIVLDLSLDQAHLILLREVGFVDGVIHFAALKSVAESMAKPLLYFQNNVQSLIQVLKWIELANIPAFIFSSSCTVYGSGAKLPVTEDQPFLNASSAYGRSKQCCEWITQDVVQNSTKDLKAVSLRYFNPAGAHPSHHIGESPLNLPQNLVPVVTETAIGKRSYFEVYGNDYDTPDGSCLRDYIHVSDLAKAHVKAFQKIDAGDIRNPFESFNIGVGRGVSVLEAIQAFERVTGIQPAYKISGRRSGDLPAMYANVEKAERMLDWKACLTIEDIMADAWAWEQIRNNRVI